MSGWLDFERMIAQIYRSLSPNAVVTHNDSIPGNDSGTKRPIDVSVRFREAGCDFLIVVQAKTNSRPLDVNVVGEFATVIKDVRASKGVLVCNAGFTKNAQTLARSLGIELTSAHDAESKDWSTTLRIPVIWVRLQPYVQFSALMELEAGDAVSTKIGEWKFRFKTKGEEFSVLEIFTKRWNGNELSKEPKKQHSVELDEDEFEFFAGAAWRNASDLKLSYTVNRQLLRNELETREFTGLRNQLSGKLEIADLKIAVPPRLPEHGWSELTDDEAILVSTENTFVTVEDPILLQDAFGPQSLSMEEILR